MIWEIFLIGIVLFIICAILLVISNYQEDKREKYEAEIRKIYHELDVNDDITGSLKIFIEKEKVIRELINKKFAPGTLTNTKFINALDYWSNIFTENYEISMKILDLDPKYVKKYKDEASSKMILLKEIVDKMGFLEAELIINIDKDKVNNDKIKELAQEMQDQIDSLSDYE